MPGGESEQQQESLNNESPPSEQWERDYYHCRLRRWDRFETELQNLLNLLLQEQRRFLVVSRREGYRFVQFAVQKDGGVAAEAVSNKFVTGADRLSQATCKKLLKLSWKRPGKRSPKNSACDADLFWHSIPPNLASEPFFP